MTIRVMVVDDHPIVRIGLCRYFSAHGGISVVAQSSRANALACLAQCGEPDVAVLDLTPKDTAGIDALFAIRRRAPDLPILVFSASPIDHHETILERAGTYAYLSKTAAQDEVVAAVCRLHATRRATAATDVPGEPCVAFAKHHRLLTNREFQIFLHLARGQSNAAAAHALSLSADTVGTYRSRLLRKLGLPSNSALTRYAMDAGLI